MGEKTLHFSERLLAMVFWVVVALVIAGFLLKFAVDKGILPGVAQWIGNQTNLQAQAGG